MNEPSASKTWEWVTNIPAGSTVGEMVSWRSVAVTMLRVMTDTVIGPNGHHGHAYNRGNIQNVSGSTFRINLGDDTFDPAKIGNVVGKTIKLRGNTTANNDGDFSVTAQTDLGGGNWVLDYVNASGAAEAMIGSVNIIAGNFTFPMILRHTASQPEASTPTAGDGIDRFDQFSDWAFTNAFNNSYFVVRCPVTGSEFCVLTGNTAVSNDGPRGTIVVATAPGVLTAPPAVNASRDVGVPQGQNVEDEIGFTIPASQRFHTNNDQFIFQDNATHDVRMNLMISDDGEQMRFVCFQNGVCNIFAFDAVVENPKPAWAADANTPVVAGMLFPTSSSQNPRSTFANWNDNAFAVCSRIPSPIAGRLPGYAKLAYLASEGYGSAAGGQNITVPNELTGEWPFLPIAIWPENSFFRGRMGTIPDMWWTSTGLQSGITFPNDDSRNLLSIDEMVVFWPGDPPEVM